MNAYERGLLRIRERDFALRTEATRQREEKIGTPCDQHTTGGHYFQRDRDGVWHCQNAGCPEKRGSDGWPL